MLPLPLLPQPGIVRPATHIQPLILYLDIILGLTTAFGDGVKRAGFADDLQATGFVKLLKLYWNQILKIGPSFGYYSNPLMQNLADCERRVSQIRF